ncbi:prohibitin family protein [Candidatus Peregrinibacteria bacterium]|nr:prohibitin family protein [Candidatus Peregrinibacteria bacterium]
MVMKYVIRIIGGIILLVFLVNILSFFTIVQPGERGLLLQFGTIKAIYEPGLHFQVPIVNKVVILDVRTQKNEVDVSAASKDLQEIQTRVALNYHADPSRVDQLYQNIGDEYETRIISPAIQESVKAITAQFTAEELITKRAQVKEQIRSDILNRLQTYFIVIDDLSIVDFNFSPEFDRAIEAKQTAVQQALKAENDLRRIEIEAQQKIATAEAEAESIRIQGEALKENADLIELKAVERWNGVLPAYMMGDTIPLLNL